MAKTKEKEIELKVKAEKISEEHLKELQGIINNINQTQINIGKLEAQKHSLLHDLAITQNKVSIFQDTLNKEYGNDDVNIVDGTINWKEDEK
tara:strand:+ start:1583 stop:1858 length:276 start_codon:yes stop_codon:yes gene_type:complete